MKIFDTVSELGQIEKGKAVLEAAGVQNVLTKCLGSHNPHNLVKATLDGLRKLRSAERIAALRGIATEELSA